MHLPDGDTFVPQKSLFLREYPYSCRSVDILGKAATPLSLSNSFLCRRPDLDLHLKLPYYTDKCSVITYNIINYIRPICP